MTEKLKIYSWEGVDTNGMRVRGEIHANNIAALKSELRRQMITPIKAHEKFRFFSLHKSLKSHQIMDFTRQLTTLINANIAIVPALQIIGKSNLRLQTLVNVIKNKIESGSSLSAALSQYPQYFDALFCNLVYAGEQSSTLGIMLKQIVNYQEKQNKLNNKIKKTLIYPLTVLIIAFLVATVMLIFVVPQFQTMFQSFGAQLPLYTQFIIKISSVVKAYSGWIVSGLILAIFVSKWLQTHSKVYAYKIDNWLIKIPLLGSILTKAIIARFARTLATTFNAGVSINDALKIIAGSCGNLVYTEAILQIREQINAGTLIHTAIKNTALFPSHAVQMLAIGEESGELTLMLEHIAAFYEQKVDDAADNFSKLLEPALMIFLGLIIGGLIAAMYLPIFKLGSVI